ncbi:hypothetical protein GW17_00031013 [Ensete ventricosum]|nr:hypothetical protein GW17_00031013 [Ensete ventricosum]RZS27981.1 hypothetical protein BHM03_00061529 [Ensete ventricosum]
MLRPRDPTAHNGAPLTASVASTITTSHVANLASLPVHEGALPMREPRKRKPGGGLRCLLKMFIEKFKVDSPNVRYVEEAIEAVYHYETTELVHENREGDYHWVVKPKTVRYDFKTDTRVDPDNIVFGGWDISDMNLADAMARAKVLDLDLQKQLRPYMESMVPLPGIFDPDFVAANQERYSNVVAGLNDTVENLMTSLEKNDAEISPSTLYGIACVLENVPYINGSPQNTFVPGVVP